MPMRTSAQAVDPGQLVPHLYRPPNADAVVELVDLGDFVARARAPA